MRKERRSGLDRRRTEYDSRSIKILSQIEQDEFNFALVARLTAEFPLYSERIIRRGIEACRRAGVSTDYFIERYLKDNKVNYPLNKLVEDAYKDID